MFYSIIPGIVQEEIKPVNVARTPISDHKLPDPNQQTIMDTPGNSNDVYIDGDQAELSRLEKPGSWKVGRTHDLNLNYNVGSSSI